MDVVEPAVVMSAEPEASKNTEAPIELAPSLRHRIEYALLRGGVALARVTPVRALTATGAGLAWTVGPWLRQNRRALTNLEIAFPQKSDAERRRIARAMWANMGRLFAETLVLDRIVADPANIVLADSDDWQARLAMPGPSLGCTLHLGNWELAVWHIMRGGRSPAGVYKPLDNPLVDRWLAQTRSFLYPGGLFGKGADDRKSGQRTARKLIDVARKGHCLVFVCDHFDRRGTPIPFMGQEAKFTTVPALIARHVGARLWVGQCLRLGTSSRFRMEIREIEVPRTGDKQADAIALTTAVFAVFEAWIRAHPEQWMWWNTRWVRPAATDAAERS